MFRNYLAAALRHMLRSPLYATISVTGLAVGFAAALFTALFVRDELSYDRWIPGVESISSVVLDYNGSGAPSTVDYVPSDFAAHMPAEIPAITEVARLFPAQVALRSGNIESPEEIYWADATIFQLLPLPALFGDVAEALRDPNAVVISRRVARKYFGRDNVLGERLELDREHQLVVSAVIEDLPSNTNLHNDIFAAGRAAFSGMRQLDENPRTDMIYNAVHTFIRTRPDTDFSELNKDLAALSERHRWKDTNYHLRAIPLTDLHLQPVDYTQLKPRGKPETLRAFSATAILIIVIAVINFTTLMTARAGRRATEVGVRKASGAERRHLIVQFIGESLVYVVLGGALALGLGFALLPAFNAFLDRTIDSALWSDPKPIMAGLALLFLTGCLAGSYPALVLARFSPAQVLKDAAPVSGGSGIVRQGLVLIQFAVLVGLLIAAVVIQRQADFALRRGMGIHQDEILLVEGTACGEALVEEFRKVPGVLAAACTSGVGELTKERRGYTANHDLADGRELRLDVHPLGFGFFELYGIAPLSGRLFSPERSTDQVPVVDDGSSTPAIILNESAARGYGFADPAAAVGKLVPWERMTARGQFLEARPAEVIGVVPDFSLYSVRQKINPTVYFVDPGMYRMSAGRPVGTVSLRLDGRRLLETVEAIEGVWKRQGEAKPFQAAFLNQRIEAVYRDLTRQGGLSAIFVAVAVFVAALGLFGLSAFIAAQRTKEIGVRKAMGARTSDVLRLLIWQFLKPVLWANTLAWPAGYFAMHRWLGGFAYHIELSPWMFLTASAAALVIALATVSGHALLVARAQPVTALRYE